MGNRANVIFSDGSKFEDRPPQLSPAIYLHWNGGPDSVYAFLAETFRRMSSRGQDVSYMSARFVQIVGDFFGVDGSGGCLSLGIVSGPESMSLEALAAFDCGDNGIYVVEPLGIRRFVWTPATVENGDIPLREMSEEEVARERRDAESENSAAVAYLNELKQHRLKFETAYAK